MRQIATGTALLSVFLCGGMNTAFAQETATDDTYLADIIVTAQKREQSLQDVPISITAVTRDALAGNRITNIIDLQTLVPNVAFRPAQGGAGIPGFSMRGLETVGTAPGRDKAISPYLDGVYIGSSYGAAFDLPDLERIEVLRGPQGTLFGRNATAGAISIITRDPSGEFGLRQLLSYGNYNQFRSSTRLELPAWGPLSASISYTHDERKGDIRNLGAGQFWDRRNIGMGTAISPKRLGNRNSESLFFAAKLAASDAFQLTYKFDWVSSHFTPEGTGLVSFNPTNATIAALFAANPIPIAGAKRPKEVQNWWTIPGRQKVYGHNLTANLTLSDNLSLKNILAYRNAFVFAASQVDGAGGLRNVLPALGPIGDPYIVSGSQAINKDNQWSNELQLNFDSRLVTLTAGVLYFRSKGRAGNSLAAQSSVTGSRVYTGGIVPTTGLTRNEGKARSLAGYLQAEVHVLPEVDVIGGIRYTQDKKDITTYRAGARFDAKFSDSRPSYLAGVNFKPTDDILLFAKYSTGFVSGGTSFDVVYGAETVKSIEAGVKADLFDNRVRFNLALWRARYLNQQASVLGVNIGRPELGAVLVSLGDLTAKGFEGELTIAPTRGLSFNGGVGYTGYHLTSVNPLLGTLETFVLNRRPHWTTNLSGQYETEPLFGDASLLIRADASWRSRISTYNNINVPERDEAIRFSPASWTVNSRIALRNMRFGSGKAELAFWAKNIFDNDVTVFPINFTSVASASYERARTFGIDLILDY